MSESTARLAAVTTEFRHIIIIPNEKTTYEAEQWDETEERGGWGWMGGGGVAGREGVQAGRGGGERERETVTERHRETETECQN